MFIEDIFIICILTILISITFLFYFLYKVDGLGKKVVVLKGDNIFIHKLLMFSMRLGALGMFLSGWMIVKNNL